MVRKAMPIAEEPQPKPTRVPNVPTPEEEHALYWSREAIERRARFLAEAGEFHIADGFRIVCDAYVDGLTQCGNVIGFAPLPNTHDGLCDRCRSRGFPFPPRITLDPSKVVYPGDSWNPAPDDTAKAPLNAGDAWEPVGSVLDRTLPHGDR